MAAIAAVGLAASLAAAREPAAPWPISPTAEATAGAAARPRSAAPARGRAQGAGARRGRPSRRPAPEAQPGAMASDVATMQPTMILKPMARRLGRERQRLRQPAGLVELDVDGVIAAAKTSRSPRVCSDSSAHTGTGRGDTAPERHPAPAGSGCSMSSKPASAATAISSGSIAGVQASLASAISRACGQAARIWRMRSASPAPPSLIFSSGIVLRRCGRLGGHVSGDRRG